MKICLYQAIPSAQAMTKRTWPPLRQLKSQFKNRAFRLATRATGRLWLDHYDYLIANALDDSSNRGDISLSLAIRQQLVQALHPASPEFIELPWGALNDDTVATINRECDLFVIGGGGYIGIGGSGALNERFGDLPFLAKIRRPKVAYGIGLNRLMHEDACKVENVPTSTRQLISGFAETFDLIAVRDDETRKLFAICTDKAVDVTGDPALFLNRQGAKSEICAKTATGVKIGLNLAAHGWRSISVLKGILADLVPFLHTVKKTHNCTFTYFLHHELERPVIAFLVDRGLRPAIVDAAPRSMLDTYASMDFVICQMLHSCIFSANVDVPFMNVAYDTKCLSFASLLGLPSLSIPCYQVDQKTLEQRFETLFACRASLSKQISERKAQLSNLSELFRANIASLITSSTPVGD
jgi:polysaccharide pyruvyl transferase WcaK-like protein